MIEYAQARVRVNNLTTFIVINLIERVGSMSLTEMESTMLCLFVLEFYGLVNNEVMSSRSVNSGTVPWQA